MKIVKKLYENREKMRPAENRGTPKTHENREKNSWKSWKNATLEKPRIEIPYENREKIATPVFFGVA